MIRWTEEKIATLKTDKIRISWKMLDDTASAISFHYVKSNSISGDQFEKFSHAAKGTVASHKGQLVIGFHYICSREKGVTKEPDGLWTGTWVTAKHHPKRR